MIRLLGAVCVIAFVAICVAQTEQSKEKKTAAKLATAVNPYNGTWEFVAGKSHLSGASAGLSSLTVNVLATKSKFDWTATGADSAGHEVALAYGGAIDGKPRLSWLDMDQFDLPLHAPRQKIPRVNSGRL